MRTGVVRRPAPPAVAAMALVLALGTLLAGALACAPDRSAPASWRWIEGSPGDELKAAQLREVDCVLEPALAQRVVPDGVHLGADAAVLDSSGEYGLTLRGGAAAPYLDFARRFEPGEIDALFVRIAGVRRGAVRVSWQGSGEKEVVGRLELPKESGAGTLHDNFLFDLTGRLPGASSFTLRLEPTTVAGEVVTVSEICIGRARLSAERLNVAARLPWKATLADDARDVLVVPSAGVVEKRGVLPPAARLSFGVGRLSGSGTGARVKLEATGKSGPPRVVVDRLLGPAELVAGWTDFKVELDDFAPGPVDLRLAVVPEPASDVDFAAVVSAPRIWSASGPAATSERPNLVLISLDTLRADHLSLYGYPRPTSPKLDAWVRDHRSVTFRQVVPPSGWTLPSHFSLFTGLEAFRHPANYYRMAVDASAYGFLAELLREAGYRTQAFTAGGFVHPIYGLAKGFDSFAYLASTELRLQELEMSLARVGSWLDEGREEPFLLFLHTYEIHTPNPARQPYFDRFSDLPADWTVDVANNPTLPDGGFLAEFHPVVRKRPEEPASPVPNALTDLPRDAYDSAIAFTDEKLAPLLKRLTEPPFDRNTVVVLFSDHGESFGELGRWGHANLTLSNLRVPLVVVLPGRGEALTVPSQVRLIDLFPTLLELAGVAVPDGIDGESLGPLLAGAQEPAGRPAWAYSASTNHGLSLLSPNGLKLDWRNSVWKPIAGELVWFRTREFDEELLATAPETAEAREMPRRMESTFGRRAAGLRLEFENLADLPLKLGIHSDLVDPASVKSARIAGPGLDWKYIGFAEVHLGPRETLSFHLERALRPDVELAIEARGEGCAEAAKLAVATRVEKLRETWSKRLAVTGCAPGVQTGGLELRLQWRGPAPAATSQDADQSLKEDLAALGYLH
jgi:arylsulfatase A-like enzyme